MMDQYQNDTRGSLVGRILLNNISMKPKSVYLLIHIQRSAPVYFLSPPCKLTTQK